VPESETFEAIVEGVCLSISRVEEGQVLGAIEDATKSSIPSLDPERIYRAIEDGVCAAITGMVHSATSMPGSDFFLVIEKAAREAFSGMVVEVRFPKE